MHQPGVVDIDFVRVAEPQVDAGCGLDGRLVPARDPIVAARLDGPIDRRLHASAAAVRRCIALPRGLRAKEAGQSARFTRSPGRHRAPPWTRSGARMWPAGRRDLGPRDRSASAQSGRARAATDSTTPRTGAGRDRSWRSRARSTAGDQTCRASIPTGGAPVAKGLTEEARRIRHRSVSGARHTQQLFPPEISHDRAGTAVLPAHDRRQGQPLRAKTPGKRPRAARQTRSRDCRAADRDVRARSGAIPSPDPARSRWHGEAPRGSRSISAARLRRAADDRFDRPTTAPCRSEKVAVQLHMPSPLLWTRRSRGPRPARRANTRSNLGDRRLERIGRHLAEVDFEDADPMTPGRRAQRRARLSIAGSRRRWKTSRSAA